MRAASESAQRWYVALWLLALLALGGYLRIHGVNDYYYSLDEISNIEISKGATVGQVMDFSKYETHPPYAHIARHYLMQISEARWFMRCESVLFGLLCILAYYSVGKQLGGRLAGCVAAYLIAFGYGNIVQSQIVRNYELLAWLTICAFFYYRIYLDSLTRRALVGYSASMLLALMTHYSAFFALACIGATGAVLLYRKGKNLRPWLFVNALLMLYFAYAYVTGVGQSEYQSVWSPPAGSDYNTLHYRLAVFAAYIPATVSYFLHASYLNEVSIPCTVLFVFSMIWLYDNTSRRALFYEMLLGLLLGAVLVAANIYPYLFKVGGRHAMWVLPYAVLPVSLFLAAMARRLYENLPAEQRQPVAFIAVAALLTFGVAINPAQSFFSDIREYQITEKQHQEIKTFADSLTADDVLVLGGPNAMYMLPDGINYYAMLAARKPGDWYYTAKTRKARMLLYYPVQATPFDPRDFIARLNTASELQGVRNVWFFSTDFTPLARSLKTCEGLPVIIHSYPLRDADDVAAEFIGLPYDTLMHDVIDEKGHYAHCL